MAEPRRTRLELQVMEAPWTRRQASIREVQEAFPEETGQPTGTVQTTVYRLEAKKAVRRIKKVANFHILETAITGDVAKRGLIGDLLAIFGGRMQPVRSCPIESGKLTLGEVREAEKALRGRERED